MMAKKHTEHYATEFSLALRMLVRRVRAAAPAQDQGLSWAEMSVLNRLENDGAATTADLARAEGMKPQSMGTIVAALENDGIVKREPHPTDGRQMLINMTSKGSSLRKMNKDAKHTWLLQAIGKLDEDDQKMLPELTAILKRLADS